MSLWLERMNELSRHGRYLKEAEQYRRGRELRGGRIKSPSARCRAVRWLGSRLATWGIELLARSESRAASARSAESRVA